MGRPDVFALANTGLALQLHFGAKVCIASGGLMSASPHRPCNHVSAWNASLCEPGGNASDFLNRPSDQWWRAILAGLRRVFLGVGVFA